MLRKDEIQQYLTVPGIHLDLRETVTSTNTLMKALGRQGAPHGSVMVAEQQTAGRGRLGRSFYSPAQSGVYFSILLRPELSSEDAMLLTPAAAVAVAEALEVISGTDAQIKWVNDIYVAGLKVCGILTETAYTPDGKLDFAVVGIGINLTPPEGGFPEEILGKAGTLFQNAHEDVRERAVAEVLNRFFPLYARLTDRAFIPAYRRRNLLKGRMVNVIRGEESRPAQVLDVDDRLRLLVRYTDGNEDALSTGEVTIRL